MQKNTAQTKVHKRRPIRMLLEEITLFLVALEAKQAAYLRSRAAENMLYGAF